MPSDDGCGGVMIPVEFRAKSNYNNRLSRRTYHAKIFINDDLEIKILDKNGVIGLDFLNGEFIKLLKGKPTTEWVFYRTRKRTQDKIRSMFMAVDL
jgi:hypothetical protein